MINRFLLILAALLFSASYAHSQTYPQTATAQCTLILNLPLELSCPAGQGFTAVNGSYVKLNTAGNAIVNGVVADAATQVVGIVLNTVLPNVYVQISGPATLNFDGATTAGDTITSSSTTAGYFHDTGTTTCSSTTLGVVSQTIGGTGQATAFLAPCAPAASVTGGPSGWVLLGKLASANMNATTDQAIALRIPGGAAKYIIRSITVTNASISLTTAAGGFYPAATKGGTAIVAATGCVTGSNFSLLTTATAYIDCTIATTISNTQTTIYLSLTTAQGAPATADVYVYGEPLP